MRCTCRFRQGPAARWQRHSRRCRGGCDGFRGDWVATGTAKQRREQRQGGGNAGGLRQISLAPTEAGDRQLDERRRRGAAKAVGRLQDRDRHAAAPHEIARQQRHEYDEAEAVRADRHNDPVEQDDLPKRGDERAAQQPDKEHRSAQREQTPRAKAIDQRPDQRRAAARNELRDRIGDRGLAAAPAELLNERDEKDGIGMHDCGAGRERGKGAAEHQPRASGSLRSRPCQAGRNDAVRGNHLLTCRPLRRCDRVSVSRDQEGDLYGNCTAGRTARVARAPLRCCVIIGLVLAMSAQVRAAMCIENATLDDLQAALSAGEISTADLVLGYLARIEAYDRAGPRLNAVREVNPEVLAIAAQLDANKPGSRRPLEGIPILVKDNIATADAQHTTAGSLALEEARAKDDATVVKLLRRAGAVILGKANLTEFANILAVDMPAGYSSLGGQVKNPYAPELDDKGVPIVIPGGSSSGSAVAVTAGLAAAAIGTETSGSLLSPAGQNGVVTVKPTVGLVSRAGIVPIAHSQDTAGPMTRTVRDAAILLNVLAAADPLDPATNDLQRPADYTSFLDEDGLKGARIGVPSDPADPGNDVYYGTLPPRAAAVMRDAIAVLEAQGATIIRANIPTEGWIGGPATEMAILNRNPESPTRNQPVRRPIVFLYELKHDLNLYLRDWAAETAMRSLADIIAFNAANAERALRFGQDIFLAAEATRGDLSELEYLAARQMDLRASRTLGLDAYMDAHRLDAVLFPGTNGAPIAAKAGYPSVQVPAGFVSGARDRDTPDYPYGATFTGRA